MFVRGAPESLKSSVVALLCRSEFTVGTATIQLVSLNAMRITGLQGARYQVAVFDYQRQNEYDCNGQQSQSIE